MEVVSIYGKGPASGSVFLSSLFFIYLFLLINLNSSYPDFTEWRREPRNPILINNNGSPYREERALRLFPTNGFMARTSGILWQAHKFCERLDDRDNWICVAVLWRLRKR